MKKKGDMRRLFREGRTGLRTDINLNAGLVFFFFFSQLIYPQIPVNGFCSFKSIQVPSGFEHLVQSNPDLKEDPEFILYSPNKKEFLLLQTGTNEIIRSKGSKSKFLSEISSLININKHGNPSQQFAFTSRKNREAGILNFITAEEISFLTRVEFDSYPENLSIADVNADGVEEYLVSGSGFDGLSVLYLTEDRFDESKITSGSSYRYALFTDLSNDGFPDILAYNLINRTLEFFYNDSQGNFELVRATDTGEIISNILALDINGDGYDDIIFSEKNGIRIIYGDPESKFSDRMLIKTEYSAQMIAAGDFNRDKLKDLVYADKSTGVMSIIFAMNNDSYFNEIVYTRKSELSDLKIFRQGSDNSIALLSRTGSLYIFSNLIPSDFSSQFNLVPSAVPEALGTFDARNDGIKDLYLIDRSENILMLYLRNKDLIPSVVYPVPLAENYTDIRTDETFPAEKTFYCFSKGSKLIEVVRINFTSNKIQKKQLYSPGMLEDLKIKRTDKTLVEVFIIYHKSNKLHLGKYEHRDLSITFKEFPAVDLNVIDAGLILKDRRQLVYYWKESSDTLIFTAAEIKTGPNEYTEYFSVPGSDGMKIFTLTGESGNSEPYVFSMVVSNKNNAAIKAGENESAIYFPVDGANELKPKNIHKLFFSGNQNSGINELMVYIPSEKSLDRFEFFSDEKNFKLVPVLQVENLNYYVIDNFSPGDNHLIFSNNKEGCISIIQLSK